VALIQKMAKYGLVLLKYLFIKNKLNIVGLTYKLFTFFQANKQMLMDKGLEHLISIDFVVRSVLNKKPKQTCKFYLF
jgi:hypothetical protein